MSSGQPNPYPVVYDVSSGSLQYVFQTGQITIPEASVNAITALTGDVTASGPGSAVATLTNTAVTGQHLTGFVQGVGVVAATDTILTAMNKLAGAVQAGSGGEVPYSASGSLAYDTAFNWDGTHHRLGIGTGSPIYDLEIDRTSGAAGSVTASIFNGATTGNANWQVENNSSHVGLFGIGGATYGGILQDATYVFNSNGTGGLVLCANTGAVNICAGGTTPQITLATTGVATFTQAPVYPVGTLAGTGTVTPNAINGPTFTIPVSGNVTLNGPSNPIDGAKVTIRVVNDGSHSVTLATGAGNYSFGTTITGYTNSTSTIDYIGVIYNASASRWHVVAISQGF